MPSAFTVTGAGQVKVGAVTSTTVTIEVQVDALPAASLEVNVTKVVPKLNACVVGTLPVPFPEVAPLNWYVVTSAAAPQLSDVAAPYALLKLPTQPLSAESVMLFGQAIDGWSSSCTVTLAEQVFTFPATSVAVYTTIVVPATPFTPG